MSWSKAGNEFQEKRCLFCAGAHIPYTCSAAEIAPHLRPASARACSCRRQSRERTRSSRNPLCPQRPPTWKAWPAPSPGSVPCSRPGWRRTAVAWAEKGIGFHRLCNPRQGSLPWGEQRASPRLSHPLLPVSNAPVDIEGKLFAEFLHSPPSNCWRERGSEKEREFKAGSALAFWAISTSGQL